MSEDVERVLKEHVVSPATGGTATGSTWRCTCGASATVNGVRSWADEEGRAHLAGAILAALTPTPDVDVIAEVRAHCVTQRDAIRATYDPSVTPYHYYANACDDVLAILNQPLDPVEYLWHGYVEGIGMADGKHDCDHVIHVSPEQFAQIIGEEA